MGYLANKKATVTVPTTDASKAKAYEDFVLRPWLHDNAGRQGIHWDWRVHEKVNEFMTLDFTKIDVDFWDEQLAVMFALTFSEIQYDVRS